MPVPEDWPLAPETGLLVKGLTGFGYTETGQYCHSEAEPLLHFLGKWFWNMIGKVKVENKLREFKGKTLLHMIKPLTYAHALTVVEDYLDKWHQDMMVAQMKDNKEKEK